MAAALVPALGVVANLLKIVSFMGTNMPGQQDEGPSIRIKAANPGDDNAEGGVEGDVAEVYAWDVENNYLGKADGGDLEIGDVLDVIVDSSSPGARAEYVGVTMGKDAVCMAWISVTQFDGTTGGAWTGDVGYECGQNWYHNKEKAGYLEEDMKEPYIPRCTWLDEDHSDDIPSATMKFSVSAYGENVTDTVDNAKACDSTIFGADNAPINEQPAPQKAKRDALRKARRNSRLPWMEKRLIVSDMGHSAEELCTSETSWGPDFADECLYCDMATHEIHPLCSCRDVEGCVNVDENERSVKKRSTVAKRSIETTHKSFETVKRWSH